MESKPASLIEQFLHKNWSIKTEMLVFLGSFYLFFNMLLWPDPGTHLILRAVRYQTTGLSKLLIIMWRLTMVAKSVNSWRFPSMNSSNDSCDMSPNRMPFWFVHTAYIARTKRTNWKDAVRCWARNLSKSRRKSNGRIVLKTATIILSCARSAASVW